MDYKKKKYKDSNMKQLKGKVSKQISVQINK